MRAVKNNLPTPSGEVEESDGPRWTRAVGDQSGHPLYSKMKVKAIGSHVGATRCLVLPAAEEERNDRGGWDDFLGTVEVAITTPLLFWPLTQLGERGLSYRLTNDH